MMGDLRRIDEALDPNPTSTAKLWCGVTRRTWYSFYVKDIGSPSKESSSWYGLLSALFAERSLPTYRTYHA